MEILRIFNVSDYIHAGAAPRTNSYSKPPTYYAGVRDLPDGSYAGSFMPVGGISFSLNPIFESIAKSDKNSNDNETLVFCIDDAPRIKREMYKNVFQDEMGYKSNRSKKILDVSIQRDAIKDIMSTFSKNVLFAPGYEADDIIASLVFRYKNSFDSIVIHTRDSDLFSLVCDNVSIGLVGTQGKIVTKENYSTVVFSKDNTSIPYNGILIDKLIKGDTSDNIQGIGRVLGDKVKNYIPEAAYKYLIDFDRFIEWVGNATDQNEAAIGIAKLVTPLRVSDGYTDIYDDPIDLNRLYYLGSKVQNKYCTKEWIEDINDVKEVMSYWSNEYYMRGGK